MGGIAKIRYTHEDIIDFIISNPGVGQGEIAARYGYSQGWLSQVMSSDAFRAALAARREEIVDPTVKLSVEERFRGMASRSLDRLMEKLDAPVVSDALVLKAVEMGAKALGIGGDAPPPAVPQDHFMVLAARLAALNPRQSNSQGVLDVEAKIVSG